MCFTLNQLNLYKTITDKNSLFNLFHLELCAFFSVDTFKSSNMLPSHVVLNSIAYEFTNLSNNCIWKHEVWTYCCRHDFSYSVPYQNEGMNSETKPLLATDGLTWNHVHDVRCHLLQVGSRLICVRRFLLVSLCNSYAQSITKQVKIKEFGA